MVKLGIDTKIYQNSKLTFILTPTQTMVRTSLQTFYLVPAECYWVRRLKLIRRMIEVNEIRDLNELAGYCGGHIRWTGTGVGYDISNCTRICYDSNMINHDTSINNSKQSIRRELAASWGR